MRIGIFEDKGYYNLLPLTYTRAVFDLRCGMYLLREKIEKQLSDQKIDFFVRNSIKELLAGRNPGKTINQVQQDDYLFLNARAVFDTTFLKNASSTSKSVLYKSAEVIVAAFVKSSDLNLLKTSPEGLLQFDKIGSEKSTDQNVKLFSYSWEFVHENGSQISRDYVMTLNTAPARKPARDGVHIVNPEQVFIADSARVDPGVVILADEGPVYIDEGARIFPQATIVGPAYIGKKSVIKIGAKIYEGTSIGEVCKIGGEVEESIIHSYSNKQHDGFLGHAYLGQWINLGADTNNSDLKNNYGSVRVYVNGSEVDSGSTFVGLTMGDHSKSGINTMFNTGTTVGIMCNVFGSDFPPKWIPNFSWGGAAGFTEHEIDKAIALAKKVMARRKIEMHPAEERLFRSIFEQSRRK